MATIKKRIMTNAEIYELINDAIKPANWKKAEMVTGKRVDIFSEWHEQLHQILSSYRKNSWVVYWMNDCGKEYLEFEFPKIWRK